MGEAVMGGTLRDTWTHTLSFASSSSIPCTLFDLCGRVSPAGFCTAIILDRGPSAGARRGACVGGGPGRL